MLEYLEYFVEKITKNSILFFFFIRFVDNLGDPRGFKMHLIKSGLKKGLVKSIRGNRLHLFFQQAHTNNRDVFTKYLKTNCPKNIDFLHKLQHEYANKATRNQPGKSVATMTEISHGWFEDTLDKNSLTWNKKEQLNVVKLVGEIAVVVLVVLKRQNSKLNTNDLDVLYKEN